MQCDLERTKRLYQALELPNFSSIEEVRRSYKALALKYHPDKNLHDPSAIEKFRRVCLAYDILSNDAKKQKYDLTLRRYQSVCAGSFASGGRTPRSVGRDDAVPAHCATSSIFEELNTYALRKAERPGRRAPSISTPREDRPSHYTKEQRNFFKKREREHQAELRKRCEQEKREQLEKEREAILKEQMKREETQHVLQLHRAINSARRAQSSRLNRSTPVRASTENDSRVPTRQSVARNVTVSAIRRRRSLLSSSRTRCSSVDPQGSEDGVQSQASFLDGVRRKLRRSVDVDTMRRAPSVGVQPHRIDLIEDECKAREALEAAACVQLSLLRAQAEEAWERAFFMKRSDFALENLFLLEREKVRPSFVNTQEFNAKRHNGGLAAQRYDMDLTHSRAPQREDSKVTRSDSTLNNESVGASYRRKFHSSQDQTATDGLPWSQREEICAEEQLLRSTLFVLFCEVKLRYGIQEEERANAMQIIRRRAQERHGAYLKCEEERRLLLAERKANAVVITSLKSEVHRLQRFLKSLSIEVPDEREQASTPTVPTPTANYPVATKPGTTHQPRAGPSGLHGAEGDAPRRSKHGSFSRTSSSVCNGFNLSLKTPLARRGASPRVPAGRPSRATSAQKLLSSKATKLFN